MKRSLRLPACGRSFASRLFPRFHTGQKSGKAFPAPCSYGRSRYSTYGGGNRLSGSGASGPKQALELLDRQPGFANQASQDSGA